MKRIICLVLALVMCLGLFAACQPAAAGNLYCADQVSYPLDSGGSAQYHYEQPAAGALFRPGRSAGPAHCL